MRMKSENRHPLLSLVFVLLMCWSAQAQGDLKFVQVLKIVDVDQVVPAGKVWKLESYHQQTVGISTSQPTTGCADLARPRPYYIDNTPYHHLVGIGNGTSILSSTAKDEFPIWLGAGRSVRTSCPGDFISVLEFSIIP
jgi:hypothetical protein